MVKYRFKVTDIAGFIRIRENKRRIPTIAKRNTHLISDFEGAIIYIGNIQEKICKYFNITLEQLQSKSRKTEIVQARQLSVHFCAKFRLASYEFIAKEHGLYHHSTVVHCNKTVNNLLSYDKKYKEQYQELEKLLYLQCYSVK